MNVAVSAELFEWHLRFNENYVFEQLAMVLSQLHRLIALQRDMAVARLLRHLMDNSHPILATPSSQPAPPLEGNNSWSYAIIIPTTMEC